MNFLINVLSRQNPAPTGMTAFLGDAGKLFAFTMQGLGKVVQTVSSNPLMMIGFLLALTGFVIGIFRRLVNVS